MHLTHSILTTLTGILHLVVDPTPVPTSTPQQMDFPEVTTWLDNFTALIKVIGLGVFLISMGAVAILFMTTFGNERQAMLARAALFSVVLGLVLLLVGLTLKMLVFRITGIPQ